MVDNIKKITLITIILIICGVFTGCRINNVDNIKEDNEELGVDFIDVGKGDCILLTQGGKSMLIDAGYKKNGKDIKAVLDEKQITSIDVVIVTHPDKDHIGGMSYIIDNVNINKLYMPDVSKDSSQYESLVKSIDEKGITVLSPTDDNNKTFMIGDAECTILAPNSNYYDDINDYSIVVKVRYGETAFLFMGDALNASEDEILKSGVDLNADVIKISHHGNDDASSEKFLDAVNPKYAVITVSGDSSDELPKNTVMQELKERKIAVYRTDENGTITAVSDGKKIYFEGKAGSYNGY